MGDGAARSLGVRIEPARLGLIAVSVLLVALATPVAGPVAFVALVAGPIAGRLLGPAAGGTAAAALVGACVVLAADLVTQHVLPAALPIVIVLHDLNLACRYAHHVIAMKGGAICARGIRAT